MPKDEDLPKPPPTASQRKFRDAAPEIRDLVKRVLQEERKVIHMKRRPEIHNIILESVKKVIQ